jgi:hypothetical protein
MKGADYFPVKVGRIYGEILAVFASDAPTLAAIGLRALVEAVCQDKGCTGHSLRDKIDELVLLGALSKDEAEFLHLTRFMGNEAAHEIETPFEDELTSALDIAEALLRTIHELPRLADMLKKAADTRRSAPEFDLD